VLRLPSPKVKKIKIISFQKGNGGLRVSSGSVVADHRGNRIDTTRRSRDGQDQRLRPERIAIKTARPSCWETNELARTTAETDGLGGSEIFSFKKKKKNSAYAHLTHTHWWTTLPWTWRRKRPSLEAETSDLDHLFTHFSVSSLLFLLFFTFLFLRLLLPSVSSPPSTSFFPSLLPQTEQQHPSRPLTKKKKSETTTQTRLATKNRNSRRAPELTQKREPFDLDGE
jgi:hypothetical protein